jgi:hypothetical protein
MARTKKTNSFTLTDGQILHLDTALGYAWTVIIEVEQGRLKIDGSGSSRNPGESGGCASRCRLYIQPLPVEKGSVTKDNEGQPRPVLGRGDASEQHQPIVVEDPSSVVDNSGHLPFLYPGYTASIHRVLGPGDSMTYSGGLSLTLRPDPGEDEVKFLLILDPGLPD